MLIDFMPTVGDWFKNANGDSFEIVACDEDDKTVEVQYFDGTVEELELDTWREMEVDLIEPPEDWSGSMDITREDYGVDLEQSVENAQLNPLDELDKQE